MRPDRLRQSSHEDTVPGSLAALEQSTAISPDKMHETNSGALRCRICGQEGAVAPSDWPES